jgi:hypothetical protein
MQPSNAITKASHEFVPATPDSPQATGYVEKEYEHQEYPKWVGDKIVNSAEEEAGIAAAPGAPAKPQDDPQDAIDQATK